MKKSLYTLILAGFLVACGGGSGSTPSADSGGSGSQLESANPQKVDEKELRGLPYRMEAFLDKDVENNQIVLVTTLNVMLNDFFIGLPNILTNIKAIECISGSVDETGDLSDITNMQTKEKYNQCLTSSGRYIDGTIMQINKVLGEGSSSKEVTTENLIDTDNNTYHTKVIQSGTFYQSTTSTQKDENVEATYKLQNGEIALRIENFQRKSRHKDGIPISLDRFEYEASWNMVADKVHVDVMHYVGFGNKQMQPGQYTMKVEVLNPLLYSEKTSHGLMVSSGDFNIEIFRNGIPIKMEVAIDDNGAEVSITKDAQKSVIHVGR